MKVNTIVDNKTLKDIGFQINGARYMLNDHIITKFIHHEREQCLCGQIIAIDSDGFILKDRLAVKLFVKFDKILNLAHNPL